MNSKMLLPIIFLMLSGCGGGEEQTLTSSDSVYPDILVPRSTIQVPNENQIGVWSEINEVAESNVEAINSDQHEKPLIQNGNYKYKDDNGTRGTALINYNNKMICTGAIVHRQWVITAAHCVTEQKKVNGKLAWVELSKSNLEVRRELYQVEPLEPKLVVTKYKVTRMHVHPDWLKASGILVGADIALLRLDQNVDFYKNQDLPMHLPDEDNEVNLNIKEIFVQHGFGGPIAEIQDGKRKELYRLSSRPVTFEKDCEYVNTYCMPNPKNGARSVFGDSGGPIHGAWPSLNERVINSVHSSHVDYNDGRQGALSVALSPKLAWIQNLIGYPCKKCILQYLNGSTRAKIIPLLQPGGFLQDAVIKKNATQTVFARDFGIDQLKIPDSKLLVQKRGNLWGWTTVATYLVSASQQKFEFTNEGNENLFRWVWERRVPGSHNNVDELYLEAYVLPVDEPGVCTMNCGNDAPK